MFNLLPPNRKLAHRQAYVMQQAVWLSTIALTVTVVGALAVLGTEYALQRWLDVVTTDVRADLITADERQTLQALATDLNELSTQAVATLQTEQNPVPDIVSMVKPSNEDISIQQISVDYVEKNVQISGMAADRAALVDYQAAMNEVPHLSAISVPVSDLTQRTKIPFTLNATYEIAETL